MNRFQVFNKRVFDIVFSIIGLLVFSPLIILASLISGIETRGNGFFTQTRIGQHGREFKVFKIKTMKNIHGFESTITSGIDPRITMSGRVFRKTKIDELPQFLNVLIGDMSFVGPRPDVPGYADKLKGEDRVILSVRPGITGPAQIYFKDEEELLSKATDPVTYNDTVIWPKKVQINKSYVRDYSLIQDFIFIIKTVL